MNNHVHLNVSTRNFNLLEIGLQMLVSLLTRVAATETSQSDYDFSAPDSQ